MMILIRIFAVALLILLLNTGVWAEGSDATVDKKWGMAAGLRSGTIVYNTEDKSSTSFLPLLYYEDKHFYLDGVEGGIYLYENPLFRVSGLARLRFFDAPKIWQNRLRGGILDWGGQLRYKATENSWLDAEIMIDPVGALHANLRYSGLIENGRFELNPYVNLRLKDSAFNSRYYALDWAGYESIDGSADLQVGNRIRFHVKSNLYLLASVEVGLLDHKVRNAEAVNSHVAASAFAGFGFFNNKQEPPREPLAIQPWIRLAQGFATPSSIGDILSGTIDSDPDNNQITSIFYGIPLTDRILGVPLELYLTPGFAYHHPSRVQESGAEFIMAVKAYYRFTWPWRMRLGLGTGFSWISKITYLERSNNEGKGYYPSDLLHYLDFSFDMNLGDLVKSRSLRNLWLGVGVHHRSAIFETAQQYGRIKGGSNYPMLYIQMDL